MHGITSRNNNKAYEPRQRSYEKVLTNSENKHRAIAIVDKFLTMIIIKSMTATQRGRQSAATLTRNNESSGSELDEDHVCKIFEKINEIKVASSGWFGRGRADDGELGKLHQELDGCISGAYDTLTPDMKSKLSALPKPVVESARTVVTNEATPLIGANKAQDIVDISYLKCAFDIVMRNDGWVFQVTIPKALGTLYNKYKKDGWRTAFIERNVKNDDSKKYELRNLALKKKYSNPFVERHLESKANGKVKLVYRLTNPKNPKDTVVLATKYRLVDGTPLYKSEPVGKGKFGQAHRYNGIQDFERDNTEYIKKKYNVVKDSRDAMSTNKEEKYLFSHYMACLQFELNRHKFNDQVRLNHPIAWRSDNMAKAVAEVAEGSVLKIDKFSQQVRQALSITTNLHKCGAFALDNKPDNYVYNERDSNLARIDLDFDALAVINLEEDQMRFFGNPMEWPMNHNENQNEMYRSIQEQYDGVDKAVIRADFYRGQSLVGLVLCGMKDCFEENGNGNLTFKPMTLNDLRRLLCDTLPGDVLPHNRAELIDFVVNWHFNRNHEEIAEFLRKYRVNNSLMDPREHLPAPETRVGDRGTSDFSSNLAGYMT